MGAPHHHRARSLIRLATASLLAATALTAPSAPAAAARAVAAPAPVESVGSGLEQVWLLRPARPPRAVVVFLHGWKSSPPSRPLEWVDQFRPWLEHLRARGAVVLFPRYQEGGVDRYGPALATSLREGLRRAFARVGEPRLPVVAAGYSVGAALALTYAANARAWRLPQPAAVDAVFPAGALPGVPLARPPASLRVLLQVGDRDANAGRGGADWFRAWLREAGGAPARYQVIRSSSGFPATHDAPKRTSARARAAFWTPLDALVAAARRGP